MEREHGRDTAAGTGKPGTHLHSAILTLTNPHMASAQQVRPIGSCAQTPRGQIGTCFCTKINTQAGLNGSSAGAHHDVILPGGHISFHSLLIVALGAGFRCYQRRRAAALY